MNTPEEGKGVSYMNGYGRTVPGYRSLGTPTDHATADGKIFICGAEVGGYDKDLVFNLASEFSCKRCIRAITR